MENIRLPTFFNKGKCTDIRKIKYNFKSRGKLNDIEKEKTEKGNKIICDCGNYNFRVYITNIIDDAELYCNKCNKKYF